MCIISCIILFVLMFYVNSLSHAIVCEHENKSFHLENNLMVHLFCIASKRVESPDVPRRHGSLKVPVKKWDWRRPPGQTPWHAPVWPSDPCGLLPGCLEKANQQQADSVMSPTIKKKKSISIGRQGKPIWFLIYKELIPRLVIDWFTKLYYTHPPFSTPYPTVPCMKKGFCFAL